MVRNLKYNDVVVEQPVFNGVNLKKWIHNGIVVWENGGELKNVLAIVISQAVGFTDVKDCFFISLTDREQTGVFEVGFSYMGLNKKYPYAMSDDRKELRLANGVDDVQLIETQNKYAICQNFEDTLLHKGSDTSYIKLKINNNSVDEIETIDISNDDETFKSVFTGGEVNGQFDSLNLFYRTETYESQLDGTTKTNIYHKLRCSDGTTKTVTTGYSTGDWQATKEADAQQCINNAYFTNGKRIYVGENSTIANYGSKNYGLIYWLINEDSTEFYKRPNAYYTNAISEAYVIKNIKYDSENDCYLSYYDMQTSNANMQKVLKFDTQFNFISVATIPRYIDVEIPDDDTYSHARIVLGEAVDIPEGYLEVLGCKNIYLPCGYYNNNAELKEPQGIILKSGDYMIYIDNLYFEDSENNFALKLRRA